MNRVRPLVVAACLMSLAVGVHAAEDPHKQVDPQVREVINKTITKLRDKRTKDHEKLQLLGRLGKAGPAAAPAVPFLLSDEFFFIQGGRTARTHPLRLATVDALIKIGEPALPEVLKLLSRKDKPVPRIAVRDGFYWKWWGGEILRRMSRTELVDVIIPVLAEEMKSAKHRSDTYSLLASMGPKSVPVLRQEARDLFAEGVKSKADANDLRRLGNLIGGEIGEAIDAVIPAHYTGETWKDDRYWIHYRGGWYPLAHARPGPKHIPAFLDLIQNDTLIRTRQYEGMRYIGMILSTMGEAPALPLAELLTHETLETRWAAAFILTMLGADAKAALPALEKTFAGKDEDIGVRVAAARAIARIKGVDSSELYKQIPDVEQKMVAAARRRSEIAQSREQWEYHFANDTKDSKPRHLHLYKKTPEHERALYGLAAGEDLQAHNKRLREYTASLLSGKNKAQSEGGGIIDKDLNAFLFMFHSQSQHYPGRLEPDVEKAMKEYAFRSVDISVGKKSRYLPKTTDDLNRILACDDAVFIMEVDNGPIRSDANCYLILQTLNTDPEYRNRKFKARDSVSKRYEKYTEFYRRGIKQWALNGLWVELGSSNYEYKTYRGLLNLIEFATDPVVATRARMWMGLCMVEIEQICLSGLRGGSKSRAKDGGLDGRFNRYLGMFYGEHHGYMLEPPGFKAYRPPIPAILLRRLGPPTLVYEIINRHPGEWTPAPEGIPQYHRMHKVLSKSINYAYRTPEYITGCAMNDVRRWIKEEGKPARFAYAPLGRWSGVIFRDGSAVYLEAYTGEKWNVQSKDVMIAQRYPGSYYKGDARVDLVGSLDVSEKDGWVFAGNGDAYAAVRIVKGGYYWNEPAHHRLYLEDQYSPILIQTGRKAVYGSFDKFQQAILAAPLTLAETTLDYTGPNSARIEFFLCRDSDKAPYPKSLPKIDGKELDLDLKHNYQSPYVNNKVGSDIVTVRYGSRRWDYDFGENTVTEVKEF